MVHAPADVTPAAPARAGRRLRPPRPVRLRVLVALTDPEASRTVRRTLGALTHRVIAVVDGLGALSALEAYRFDVVFFGPGDRAVSARQMLLAAQDAEPAPLVVLVAPPGATAERGDGCDYLSPPFTPGDVARLLDRLTPSPTSPEHP